MVDTYEYGIFNGDREKIAKVNGITPDDLEWVWLWESPIEIRLNKEEAELLRDKINMERKEEGKLESFGPVVIRRRSVVYGDWE